MMKPAVLIRFIVSFVVVIFASPGLAGDWQEFAVSPSADDQEKPDVHGERIVWQQLIQTDDIWDWDIYLADLEIAQGVAVPIVEYANDQQSAAIFADYVVWEHDDLTDWDVYVTDIIDPATPVDYGIGALADNQRSPAISGNIVVWQDDSAGDLDIWGADITDLATLAEPVELGIEEYFIATPFEANQQAPAIYRNTVIWEDDVFGDWDIWGADIWLRNEPSDDVVSQSTYDQQNVSVWGDIVVWQENIDGNWDIWAADISNPDLPVEFPISQAASLQSNPDVGDNLIVWQDYRNGKDWDIYGYNLTTRQEFQITDNDTDQINPAISGNLVVWQDYRDGPPNIYAVELTGPEVARCSVRPAGDTNGDCQVDLRDLAMTGQTWLSCGLDDQTACSY